jgi:hypothetical protein
VRVSWFSLKTKVDSFSQFSLKTGGYGSFGFASKPLAQVFRVGHQNRQLRFSDLAHKITATVSCFRTKKKWEEVCRFAPQNR